MSYTKRQLQIRIQVLLYMVIFILISSHGVGEAVGKSVIDPNCIIHGNLSPPPPFLVLKWTPNGECNSTIEHFVQFYDIRSIINNNGQYILFLET